MKISFFSDPIPIKKTIVTRKIDIYIYAKSIYGRKVLSMQIYKSAMSYYQFKIKNDN